MNLEQAWKEIGAAFRVMNERYHGVVFDEIAVVALERLGARVLRYAGPREKEIEREIQRDVQTLHAGLSVHGSDPGAFDFSFDGEGTGYDAFITLGTQIFLVCNRTDGTTLDVTRNPLWIAAQEPFVDLSQRFATDPVEFRHGE